LQEAEQMPSLHASASRQQTWQTYNSKRPPKVQQAAVMAIAAHAISNHRSLLNEPIALGN
jgi:hypothetical protein